MKTAKILSSINVVTYILLCVINGTIDFRKFPFYSSLLFFISTLITFVAYTIIVFKKKSK